MSVPRSLRRAVAVACGVAAITTGATVTSASVAPATAKAQVEMRVICQDVVIRRDDLTPTSLPPLTYGERWMMTQWPTSIWVRGYKKHYHTFFGWVDGNCLTLA